MDCELKMSHITCSLYLFFDMWEKVWKGISLLFNKLSCLQKSEILKLSKYFLEISFHISQNFSLFSHPLFPRNNKSKSKCRNLGNLNYFLISHNEMGKYFSFCSIINFMYFKLDFYLFLFGAFLRSGSFQLIFGRTFGACMKLNMLYFETIQILHRLIFPETCSDIVFFLWHKAYIFMYLNNVHKTDSKMTITFKNNKLNYKIVHFQHFILKEIFWKSPLAKVQ